MANSNRKIIEKFIKKKLQERVEKALEPEEFKKVEFDDNGITVGVKAPKDIQEKTIKGIKA